MIWGEIYVKGTSPLAIWSSTNVRLFGVRQAPQPRTVGDFVGGLLGNASGAAPPSSPHEGGGHSRRVSRQL